MLIMIGTFATMFIGAIVVYTKDQAMRHVDGGLRFTSLVMVLIITLSPVVLFVKSVIKSNKMVNRLVAEMLKEEAAAPVDV
jgi:hypothetical protein